MKTDSILSTFVLLLESLYEFFMCMLLIRYNTYDIVLQPRHLFLKIQINATQAWRLGILRHTQWHILELHLVFSKYMYYH